MNWEELTSDQFPQAVADADGVCLLPLSCVERHAHHLPLGTDVYIGRELCQRTAALEKAIVFPDFIFTQILEARHCAGTIAIEPDLILRLLDNTVREIARNGLKKIVIVNAHGGNNHLMHFFLQTQLASPRDYAVYVAEPQESPEDKAMLDAQWEAKVDGHAGELETSAIMRIRPDLVHADQFRADDEGLPLNRLQHIQAHGVSTGIWWYADFPGHFSGDATFGSVEKGENWLAAQARSLAGAVRAIKADSETARLQNTFFTSSANPSAQ